jgi:broad specificity phosphatase PhoE
MALSSVCGLGPRLHGPESPGGMTERPSKLILIKHSLPTIDPKQPAAAWQLSSEGVERCHQLAKYLTDFLPATLVSSHEPKARATAHQIAERLALTPATVYGLEEQHRLTVPFLPRKAFQETIRALFARPSELVFGEESADAAYTRFSTTINHLLDEHEDSNLLVVTHGTVISLFLSRVAQLDPYTLWEQLGLPSLLVVDRQTMRIEKYETRVV